MYGIYTSKLNRPLALPNTNCIFHYTVCIKIALLYPLNSYLTHVELVEIELAKQDKKRGCTFKKNRHSDTVKS